MIPALAARGRDALDALPRVSLLAGPTPLLELTGLTAHLWPHGDAPRLLVKRDDAIPFGAGGNKVRKLEMLAGEMLRHGVDTVITTGGVQSNHARATAALAAKLGLRCHLVVNGRPQPRATGNALLTQLLGAEVHFVDAREERAPAMEAIAARVRTSGGRPRVVPLGASEPLGALGYALAVGELLAQGPAPDVIVHSSSSGGTQAGLIAGCRLHGVSTRVIGISADEPSASLAAIVDGLLAGMGERLGVGDGLRDAVEVDAGFVGEGYGIPTAASIEATDLLARRDAVFLDPVYTAKAMAGLIAYLRAGRLAGAHRIVFWHTGGFPGLFA